MVPIAFIQKRILSRPNPPLDGLNYWRERILDAVLTAGGGLGLLAAIPAIFLAFNRQLWALLIGDGIVLILMGYLLFSPRRNLKFRAGLALSMAYLVGVLIIHQVGFLSGGSAWLFCFSVLSGVLLGLSA
ncbi:MAG: hypothetical protein HY787_15750 [Deltaproteobacteria bacterium]|nr:hypothetical protein [Deltaproteobacteria bacterium]